MSEFFLQIFCVHGGIPCSDLDIENINKVPVPLKDPEIESPLAWEIMWSDPVRYTCASYCYYNNLGHAWFYARFIMPPPHL